MSEHESCNPEIEIKAVCSRCQYPYVPGLEELKLYPSEELTKIVNQYFYNSNE